MIRHLFVVAVLALSAMAEDAPLFAVYMKYQDAIANGEVARAKSFLSEAKRGTMTDMEEREALDAMNVLSPKQNLRLHREIVEDDDATLVVVADVDGNRSVGRIEMIREDGAWKILAELWDVGADPELAAPRKVLQSSDPKQREAIRKLRARGFASPSADFVVMTAGTGDLESLKLFLAAGYSPDTKAGNTPAIVNAATGGQQEVVRYLIEAGADVNATDEVQTTALMRLADKCDATPTVLALLKAGAKTDGKTAGGATAAQLAEGAGCSENLKAIKSVRYHPPP